MLRALAIVVVVAVAVELARREIEGGQGMQEPEGYFDGFIPTWGGEASQETNYFEDVVVAVNPSTYTPAAVPPDIAAENAAAFLSMIAWAEGTDQYPADGYRTLFGGGQFDSYADHPRIYVPFRNTSSSAAGRYQILARTWDGLRGKLGLGDFSPASQDAAALELIRERGALNDVHAGRVRQAISKVAKVWASLPGAGYDQPERKLSALLGVYADNGGTEVTA
jgi:muramidase (phage lysozyme)